MFPSKSIWSQTKQCENIVLFAHRCYTSSSAQYRPSSSWSWWPRGVSSRPLRTRFSTSSAWLLGRWNLVCWSLQVKVLSYLQIRYVLVSFGLISMLYMIMGLVCLDCRLWIIEGGKSSSWRRQWRRCGWQYPMHRQWEGFKGTYQMCKVWS
jgi:hypothetical protein